MGSNKAINSILFVTLLFGFYSCEQKIGRIKTQISTTKNIITSKEVWTLYSKEDTTMHVKRLVSSDTGMILLSYEIDIARPEVSVQTFGGSKKNISENEAAIIKSENPNFKWRPYKTESILFIQIEPSAFKDQMEQYYKREGITERIEKALVALGHAEEVGCDVGPGGLNLLFEVENIDKAVPVIIEMLSNEGYDNKAIIGRRININKEDWFYEVIYPVTFTGVFLTM